MGNNGFIITHYGLDQLGDGAAAQPGAQPGAALNWLAATPLLPRLPILLAPPPFL